MNTCDYASEASLSTFLRAWSFGSGARGIATAIATIISCWRAGHLGGTNKPTASQLLSLLSLLRCWTSTHTGSALAASLCACCALCHEIYKAARILRGNEDVAITMEHARAITTAYANYIAASNVAHGAENCARHAKKHWLGHVALQLLQHGCIWDCFVVERLHTRIRRHSKRVTNVRRFSASVLESLYCEHCFHSKVNLEISLGAKTMPLLEQVASALLPLVPTKASDSCCFDGHNVIHAGDFAKLGSSIGRIVQAVEAGDDDVHVAFLQCNPYAPIAGQSYLVTCKISDKIGAWNLKSDCAHLQRAIAWKVADGIPGVFDILSRP